MIQVHENTPFKSVQRLAEEGEKAEAQGDIAAAGRSLAKAGKIQKAAEEPFKTEDMRQESWVFLREMQRLWTALVFFWAASAFEYLEHIPLEVQICMQSGRRTASGCDWGSYS